MMPFAALFCVSAVHATVTLPIEVMGPAGTIVPVTVNVPSGQSAGVTGLWLQIHNLSYEDKGSIQVNNSGWIDLTTPNIQFLDPSAVAYGGIGGFSTLKIIVPLPAGAVVDGNNVIQFRFNQTDGITAGYRIVNFNFVAGTIPILPASTFVNDDPSAWTAPPGGDPVHGQQLWQTATLIASPLPGAMTLRAKCMDCHAHDGGDLKYFNYSNKSIQTRAQFHGLSAQDGADLAAYIRGLQVYQSQTARPWNPPFQPGPGTSSKNVQEWDAGAGIDAVLPSDEAMVPYLLPNGTTSQFAWNANLNTKDIPINFPLLDWNHYLPRIHPVDSWGDAFLQSQGYQDYLWLSSQIQPNNVASYQSVLNDNRWIYWNNDMGNFLNPLMQHANYADPTAGMRFYSFKLWEVVKSWEVNHEDGVEGMARGNGFPTNAPSPWAWADWGKLFAASPNFITGFPQDQHGQVVTNGQLSTARYVGQSWYLTQLIVNDGNGTASNTTPIDWGYSYNNVGNDFGWYEQQAHGALMILWLVKGFQSPQRFTAIAEDIYSGWGLSNSQTEMTVASGGFPTNNPLLWSQMSTANRTLLLNSYLSAYFSKVETFSAHDIYAYPDVNAASQTVDFTQLSSRYTLNLYNSLPQWRLLGVSPSLLANIVAWATSLWPSVDWQSELNATCTPGYLGLYGSFPNGVISCTPGSTPVNQPPSVQTDYAGDPAPITLPAQAYLIGTVMDDGLPVGSTLTQTWTMASGPGMVTFGTPGSVNTTAAFSQPGTYNLQLTATDGQLSGSAQTTVVVQPAGTPPPPRQIVISPSEPNLAVNQTVQFTATAYDQFNQVISPAPAFTWSVDDNVVGTINANGFFTAQSTPGSANVTASANGATSPGAGVTVTGSAPPQIQLTSPASGANFATAPATVNVQANLIPGNNPIAQVEFFDTGLLISSFTNPTSNTFQYTMTNVGSGTHDLYMVITDNQGVSNMADSQITVGTPPIFPSFSPCDINQDGRTDVLDVQLEVNMALQITSCINPDGVCNVTAVQKVVNAAAGGQCVAP